MYRFLLFTYNSYCPVGGMGDCKSKFNSLHELAKEKDNLYLSECIEIYDFKYDNVIYIRDKESLLRGFKDYLNQEE